MTTILTYEERVKRLKTFFQTGRLIRHDFTGQTSEGKATACLLAAMSPEVGRSEDPSSCPADVMPEWFAELTPNIDDGGSLDAWHSMVQRYAQLAGDWHRLSDAAWSRLRTLGVRIALAEISLIPKNLVSQTMSYWEDFENGGENVSQDAWVALRSTIKNFHDQNETTKPDRRRHAGEFLQKNHDFMLRRHAWGAMMAAAKAPSPISGLWHQTARATGADQDNWEQTYDRMTNLLFDAMQGEIDKAKAVN